MAKKQDSTATQRAAAVPQIFEATLGANGAVKKGIAVTQFQAEAARKAGRDIVVCGPDLAVNRAMAQSIEVNANGKCKRCPPHASAGSHALPHYQPDAMPPEGHTFYETPNRKAK
jgi:hypothetical protein